MSIILVLTALLGLQALALTGLALLAQEGMVRLPKGRTILGAFRGATVGAGPSAQIIRTARLRRAVESEQLRAARLVSEAQARRVSSNPSKRVSARLEGFASKASRRRQRREEAAMLEQALQHPRLEERRAKRAAARKARLLRWRKPAETKATRPPKRWGSGSAWTPPDPAKVEKALKIWRLRRRQIDLAHEWAGLEVRRLATSRRIKSLELRLRGLEVSTSAAARKARGAKAAAARWQTDASLVAMATAGSVLAGLHAGARQLRAQKSRLEATDLSLRKAQAVVDVQLARLGVLIQEAA
jgi:hypothetical protein